MNEINSRSRLVLEQTPPTTAPFPRAEGWRAVQWLVAGLAMACVLGSARAAAPRALPEGDLPNDSRLGPLKDLDGYFPFHPPATQSEWEDRAKALRLQMRVALGLWPMPPKTPLNPVIHGKIDQGDYTVEKVFFESVPGFFVTGNLYRPVGKAGKHPGILCPHGHWENGRFMDYGPQRVRQEIVQGAERFAEGGRSVLQSRCVQLARMGCVVFHYDMIGYADSQQIPMEIAHGFARQRAEMTRPTGWGLFSPQAESHLQSVMGLQTWNSIRALDFLEDLEDVDPHRLAVTGASGGGTQTFILAALDPRPAVVFPAVMVSTAMQGGCTCENASLLRIDTGNVEFAGLFAPKPLGMTAANDWTREMASKGLPELKKLYGLLGAPDHVMLKPLVHFEHNYNYVSRAAMYSWFNRQLGLHLPEPIVEEDYHRLSREQMSVWDDQHPAPPGGPEFERKLLAQLTATSNEQLHQAQSSPAEHRELVGTALSVLIGRSLSQVGPITVAKVQGEDRNSYRQWTGLLRSESRGEEVPGVLLQPNEATRHCVIWLDDRGKAGLFEEDSQDPRPEVKRLLQAGIRVLGLDLLYQGEFLTNGPAFTRTPRVKNPREAAAYTYGYNRPVFAQRVHDVLTGITYLQSSRAEQIDLVALGGMGPVAAAARALAGDVVSRTALNTGGFRFDSISDLHDPNFLPGAGKYGDLPGLLALIAPGPLWVAGEQTQPPELVQALYRKAGAEAQLVVAHPSSEDLTKEAVDWLLGSARN